MNEEFKQEYSETAALTSIAISLKRIADVMTKVPKVPKVAHLTKEQEEELKRASSFTGRYNR